MKRGKVLLSKQKSLFRRIRPGLLNLTMAAVLAISGMGTGLSLMFIQSASATSYNSYTSTPFSSYTWAPDRAVPSGGYTVSGDNLTLNVDNANANTSSSFYQTEGVQTSFSSSNGVSAELYVDPAWGGKAVRAGIWGVASNGYGSVAWPIVEYTTMGSGSFTGWRVWNTINGGWTNISTPSNGSWYTTEVNYNPSTENYEFYINGTLVNSYSARDGADVYGSIEGVIFNNYNSATGNHADDYTVQWRNLRLGTFVPDTTAPAVPTPQSPDNNIYRHTSNLNYSDWSIVSDPHGPITYYYESAFDQAFTNIAYGPQSLSTNKIFNPGEPEGTYYWRVKACDALNNCSDWSQPWTIHIDNTNPSVPANGTPHNTTIATNNFDFNWDDSADNSPITYKYQASQDPANSSGVLTNGLWTSGTLPTSMIHSSGAGDGTWYWQVKAVDAAGNESAWSQIWNVTIDTVAPTASFIFPTPGPSAKSFQVNFSEAMNLAEVENPANYFLNNWAGASSFNDLTGHATVNYDPSSHVATINFTDPGWYVSAEQQWGVRNIHDLAGNVLSETTDYSTPLANPSDPGAPTATNPTQGLSLSWGWDTSSDPGGVNASGVKGYNYQLTDISSGLGVISSGFLQASSIATTVLQSGFYSLSVQAVDNAGNASGWVNSSNVLTDNTDPDTPTPISPADNTITTTANQTLIDWSTVTDDWANPVTYIYQSSYSSATDQDGSFVSPVYTSGTLGDSQIPTLGTPEGVYYWHVQAIDGAGNASGWSTAWKITVDNTAPPLVQGVNITVGTSQPGLTGTNSSTNTISNNNGGGNNGDSSTDGTTPPQVKAETTSNDTLGATGDNNTQNNKANKSSGLKWYWWLLILLAVVSTIYVTTRRYFSNSNKNS